MPHNFSTILQEWLLDICQTWKTPVHGSHRTSAKQTYNWLSALCQGMLFATVSNRNTVAFLLWLPLSLFIQELCQAGGSAGLAASPLGSPAAAKYSAPNRESIPSFVQDRWRDHETPISSSAPGRHAASYARYSSANQNESSIDHQQQECRDKALANGDTITPEYEFHDSAVSGTVLERDGLTRLLDAARGGRISVIYFHSLSRLARDAVFTQSVLSELVHEHQVRVISLNDSIDTNQTNWQLIAALFSIQHAQYSRELAHNVRRGQVGNIREGYSGGDYCWGYTSIVAPDKAKKRRAGTEFDRRVYAIDKELAPWVKAVFNWFVHDRRSISWIVGELNRNKVAKDHRASKLHWFRDLVVSALRNVKYTGYWPWGERKNVRIPGKKVRQVRRPADDRDRMLRHMPDLRLIDDETFKAAQSRLEEQSAALREYRRQNGTLNGSGGRQCRRHLLSRIFKCGECGSTLYVGGSHAEYLLCKGHRDKRCSNHMQLPIDVAESKLLAEIGKFTAENDDCFEQVMTATTKAWKAQMAAAPDDRSRLEGELTLVDRKINKLVSLLEDDTEPDPDLKRRLRERRKEKESLQQRIAQCNARAASAPIPPTVDFVRAGLTRLSEVLRSRGEKANEALRELVGGTIVVHRATATGRESVFWRGDVQFPLSNLIRQSLPEYLGSNEQASESAPVHTVTMDFCRELKSEAYREQVWELLQQGHRPTEIAKKLQLRRNLVTDILKLVAEKYGDGKSPKELQKLLCVRPKKAPAHLEFVAPAMAMFHEGSLISEIAEELRTHRNMITAAIKAGHEALGIPVPDGRTRRTTLDYKGKNPNAGRHKPAADAADEAAPDPSAD